VTQTRHQRRRLILAKHGTLRIGHLRERGQVTDTNRLPISTTTELNVTMKRITE
jgi:hypothetical protein